MKFNKTTRQACLIIYRAYYVCSHATKAAGTLEVNEVFHRSDNGI